MKIFDCFPSKYLKAADLQGRSIEAIMQNVMMEDIRDPDEAKLLPILYFQGVPKGMVLNKTNAKVIASGYGQETDAWRDMPISLFPAMVAFGADTVEAIRVKLPPARERVVSINGSPHREALAEHMHDTWAQHQADSLRGGMRAARGLEPIVKHDADGVVWDEAEVRKPTKDDGLDIPTIFRRAAAAPPAPTPEPSLKDRLIAEVQALASPQDILRWSLSMTAKIGDVLSQAERDDIVAALQAHQAAVMAAHMPPVAHQRRLPI
jgi:hypothetical protein